METPVKLVPPVTARAIDEQQKVSVVIPDHEEPASWKYEVTMFVDPEGPFDPTDLVFLCTVDAGGDDLPGGLCVPLDRLRRALDAVEASARVVAVTQS